MHAAVKIVSTRAAVPVPPWLNVRKGRKRVDVITISIMGNFRTVVQRCVEEFSHTKGYILASFGLKKVFYQFKLKVKCDIYYLPIMATWIALWYMSVWSETRKRRQSKFSASIDESHCPDICKRPFSKICSTFEIWLSLVFHLYKFDFLVTENLLKC